MKRIVHWGLAAALLLPTVNQSFAVGLEEFTDGVSATHWAYPGLNYAVKEGLLRGESGHLHPERGLRRAELAAILTRLLDPKAEADLNSYSDVVPNAWYQKEMAKAVGMGLLQGTSATTLSPETPMSREEVVTVLSRLLRMKEGKAEALESFADAKEIAPWAKGAMAAFVEEKILTGDAQGLHPKETIRRGEFAAMMQRVFPHVIRTDVSEKTYSGRVLLTPGVKHLKKVTFEGDVFLADGIEGRVVFEDCTIKGEVISRGGKAVHEKSTETAQGRKTSPAGAYLASERQPLWNIFPVELPFAPHPVSPDSDKKPSPPKDPVVDEKPTPPVNPATDEKPAPPVNPVPDEKPTPPVNPVPDEKPTPPVNPAPDEKPTPPVNPAPDEKPTPPVNPAPDEKPTPPVNPAPEEKPTPAQPSEEIVRYGSANVDQQQYPSLNPFIHPPFYNARVKVVLDKDHRILSVADDETGVKEIDPLKTHEYWVKKSSKHWKRVLASNLFEKMKGMTRDQVAALQVETGQADAVSGATESGKAVQRAVLNAFDEKKGKTFLDPSQTLTPEKPIYPQGTTKILFKNTLPKDFALKLHSVYGGIYNADGIPVEATLEGNTLTVPENLPSGHYFVNIVDENGTYRSPDFDSGHGIEKHYPNFVIAQEGTLSFEENHLKVSSGALALVLGNIKEIVVTPKGEDKPMEIEPVGHHGTVNAAYRQSPFFHPDGSINWEVTYGKNQLPVFEPGKDYTVVLHVWGVEEPFTFSLHSEPTDSHEETAPVAPVVFRGTAPVENFGFDAHIAYTYENEVVANLRDDGSNPGHSASFWQECLVKHRHLFEGKSKAEVDRLDIDAIAEVTAKPIGKAIQKAIVNGK